MFALSSHPLLSLFFFNDTATTEIYTLSLHDALPILLAARGEMRQASELGVVLCAERVAAARTARDLERRGEGQHAFLRPGEIRADDRIERKQPGVVAVADDRPDFSGAARFLEAALDERKLDV